MSFHPSLMCKWCRSSLINKCLTSIWSARLICFHIIITSSLFIDSSWENDEHQPRHEKAFKKCKVDGQQHCAVDVSNTLRLSKPIISLHVEWLTERENYPFVLFRFRSMCNFRYFFSSMAFNAGRSWAAKGAKYGFVVYEIIFTIKISIRKEIIWKWPHSTPASIVVRFPTHVSTQIGSEKNTTREKKNIGFTFSRSMNEWTEA